MTYFVSLKITAIVVGLFYFLSHLPGVLAPAAAAHRMRLLPNNYPLGVALMLAATIWFVVLTGLMDLGDISGLRIKLMMVWAIAGVLMIIFVRGFLAVRGFGCLLLLAAALLLDAAFLAQTPARYVITVLAYIWAVAGMVFVYSPHLARDGVMYLTANARRTRAFSIPGVIFGLVLIALGIFVYP